MIVGRLKTSQLRIIRQPDNWQDEDNVNEGDSDRETDNKIWSISSDNDSDEIGCQDHHVPIDHAETTFQKNRYRDD